MDISVRVMMVGFLLVLGANTLVRKIDSENALF